MSLDASEKLLVINLAWMRVRKKYVEESQNWPFKWGKATVWATRAIAADETIAIPHNGYAKQKTKDSPYGHVMAKEGTGLMQPTYFYVP